jgi:hypothetical protein
MQWKKENLQQLKKCIKKHTTRSTIAEQKERLEGSSNQAGLYSPVQVIVLMMIMIILILIFGRVHSLV